MRTSSALLLALGCLLGVARASAQAPANTAAPSAPAQGAPLLSPASPSATPATAPPPPQTSPPAAPTTVNGPACVLGTHSGIADSDAYTAATLVCTELGKLGVRVTGPMADSVSAPEIYRVEILRLGSVVLLRLTHESPQGTQRDSRQLQLASIEEISVGAGRVAGALIHHQSLEQTQQATNLVTAETNPNRTMYSKLMFGIGITGGALVGAGMEDGYGVQLMLQHQTPHYAIGGQARIFGGDAVVGNLSIGARFFPFLEDIAPFAGGGLGLYQINVENRGFDKGGLGAYAEVGVELMRLHNSRLGFALQADFPFFRDGNYAVPLALNAYYLF